MEVPFDSAQGDMTPLRVTRLTEKMEQGFVRLSGVEARPPEEMLVA